ncbi:uncharacterized protein [Miscanthus floridulus]|uniref:uncharacterized protein n=1 Tax=Miscanthus floridulus TaxID=154761 RepID=UPI0034583CAE
MQLDAGFVELPIGLGFRVSIAPLLEHAAVRAENHATNEKRKKEKDDKKLSNIASQSALGAALLSQAFDSALVEPLSADPQKEPILVEITDASTIAENILPEETPIQEQEPDSPPNDPISVEDVHVESSEPIQPDVIGTSSVVPSLQIEAIAEKALNLSTLSNSFNLEKYLDEDEIRSIDPELSQLEARHTELEKELENMKAAIDRHKFILAQIPDAIQQKKQELLAKVREDRAIQSSLKSIPRSAKEDKQQIVEVDAIWLEVLKAIKDVLDLFVLNNRLHPLPRASEPSDAVSSTLASSSDSSDSYNSDDARRFLREWRAAQNRYSKVTRENGQLKIRLGISQAALHAAKKEASAARARLAKSDAMVAALMVQVESLQLAANAATDAVNARGALINARLHDIPACVQEIALHGAPMQYWTGLYAEVDRRMLTNGVNTMLKVATDLLLPKKTAGDKNKRLKYDDHRDDGAQNNWRARAEMVMI